MLKNDFILTEAHLEDAENIAKIEKECFSSPWSKSQIEDEINKENAIFIVAKSDNMLCGYVSGQLILDEFYISNIAVTNAFRGRSIATNLIETLINNLKSKNCIFATLEVRESNSAARHVYEKAGFINLGIRKNFYSSPTENACIYTLYFNKESENIN
ncbi:MAG: ribosomal protein S18-alanine N-acetyltransferase [Clostridia bacterium]|nr:ribosomal protein S18-alanine N-acetyltransferase [Clostridia bacterium]